MGARRPFDVVVVVVPLVAVVVLGAIVWGLVAWMDRGGVRVTYESTDDRFRVDFGDEPTVTGLANPLLGGPAVAATMYAQGEGSSGSTVVAYRDLDPEKPIDLEAAARRLGRGMDGTVEWVRSTTVDGRPASTLRLANDDDGFVLLLTVLQVDDRAYVLTTIARGEPSGEHERLVGSFELLETTA